MLRTLGAINNFPFPITICCQFQISVLGSRLEIHHDGDRPVSGGKYQFSVRDNGD